jgi:hypothetical protein
VLALTQQTLARRGKGSSDHGAILNDGPCGASVPIACEFHRRNWGQRPISVGRLWASFERPRRTHRAPVLVNSSTSERWNCSRVAGWVVHNG